MVIRDVVPRVRIVVSAERFDRSLIRIRGVMIVAEDDVLEEVKKRRLQEVVDLQQKLSLERTARFLGQVVEVLVEKSSKKSDAHWSGRNSQNTTVVFPKGNYKPGDFVNVLVTDCTSATLIGEAVGFSEMQAIESLITEL